jgi:glycosyltransferase involved in cell wall biosynthesis
MAENVGAERVTVISPWVDTEVWRPLAKAENPFAVEQGQVGKLTVMYSGNMGRSHDVETMLAAAERLRDEPGIHFLFVGGGPKWVLICGRAAEMQNVTVLPWQPPEVFPLSMATADVAVISLEPAASGLEFPSKTVFAMAAGAAILAVSRGPNDLESLVREHGCGVNVEPGDVEEFTRAVMRFHDDRAELERCRRAARRAAEQHYGRRSNVKSFLEALGLDVADHEACR